MRVYNVALVIALTVFTYVALGIGTYEATVAKLEGACFERPNAGAHVLLWPVSYGLAVGLKSGC